MAESIKERAVRRLDGLKQQRRSFEADAKEIATYALPSRSRFLASQTNKGRQPNRRLNNSHGIFAFRTLQGGMTSGLSSQSRPWMSVGSHDDGVMEQPEVRHYWAEVERLMYLFLGRTNFYGAVKTGYLEMAAFGTDACVMVEHPDEGAVCHPLTFGEYWIGLNSALQPGTLVRDCVKTVVQAVETFGYNALSNRIRREYDASNYETLCQFYHSIEENRDYEPGRLGWRGKPWRSLYWDADDDHKDRIVRLSGYEEQPFWAPRWDTTGADSYGQGPGHDALPDLRELQLQSKRKAEATDMHVWPEKVVSTKIKLKNQPKSIVSASEVDVSKLVSVPHIVPYETIAAIREDVERLEHKVNEATYADLFMAITNMQGIQPRNIEEIAARNEEKLTQLGPVIERVNNEKLEIAVERTFGIMQRMGLLPPAPEVLRENPELKIEFTSILTQMQRMVGAGQVERGTSFVGSLAAMNPEALDKLNVDEVIDEYTDRIGLPPKLIRSAKEVEKIRAARAEAQNMERMLAAAPAVKDGADAAAIVAEIGQDGALPFAGAMPL